MKEFRFLNYCTIYLATGDVNVEKDKYACFSNIFRSIEDGNSVHYEIEACKGFNRIKKGESNICLFTLQEVKNHLSILNTIFPISIKVVDNPNKFDIILDINNAPGTFHKYALTWTRYLYEYPYNVLLRDAYFLKKNEKIFTFESIANLFNLVIGCFCDNPRDIHQVPINAVTEFTTKQELKERIKRIKYLNDLYKTLKSKNVTIPEEVEGFGIKDIEYWDDLKIFNNFRKPIYLQVYSQIKK